MPRSLAIVPDKGDDFLAQIGVEHGLHVAAMKRVRALVVEAVVVDGIDGEKFDAAGVDEVGERADHALIFEFPLVAGAGGKADQRLAPVAVDHDAEYRCPSREEYQR